MLPLNDGIGWAVGRARGADRTDASSARGLLMRFPQPVRDSDGHSSPVWARKKRRGAGAGGLVGFVVTLLALFGALTAALGIKEQSLAEGGAMMDGWITAGVNAARELAGQTPEAGEAAEAAAETAGEAAATAAAATAAPAAAPTKS